MARPRRFRTGDYLNKLNNLLPFLISDRPEERLNSLIDQTMALFFDDVTCIQMRELWLSISDLERLHVATAWGFLERTRPHCMPRKTLHEYLKSCGVPQALSERSEEFQIAFKTLPNNIIYKDELPNRSFYDLIKEHPVLTTKRGRKKRL